MNDFEKLTKTFDDVGIEYTVRINPADNSYKYLFFGKPDQAAGIMWTDDNFETTDLDLLLIRNKYFEFEDDDLVSY